MESGDRKLLWLPALGSRGSDASWTVMVLVCFITPSLEVCVVYPSVCEDCRLFRQRSYPGLASSGRSTAHFFFAEGFLPHLSKSFLKSKDLAKALRPSLAFQRQNALPIHIDAPAVWDPGAIWGHSLVSWPLGGYHVPSLTFHALHHVRKEVRLWQLESISINRFIYPFNKYFLSASSCQGPC